MRDFKLSVLVLSADRHGLAVEDLMSTRIEWGNGESAQDMIGTAAHRLEQAGDRLRFEERTLSTLDGDRI